MRDIPDVLGMKMPAAAGLLDAAGASYDTEVLKPVKSLSGAGGFRVIRQTIAEDGVKLSLCAVPDGIGAEG